MKRALWPVVLFAAACASAPAAPVVAPLATNTASPDVWSPVAEPAAQPAVSAPAIPAATRIAFGSCNSLRHPQLLWDAVAALEPAAFVWLGDIIYADTEDMALMRAMYDELRAHPGYAALRTRTRVLGVWDDHDFGRNDANRSYPKRAESQELLLDFLDEPVDSPRRNQAGVYASYDIGTDPHRVRVILLDTRYHRDRPGPASDMLGEAQWTWLREQLESSTAAVHVIGSSTQLVPDQHGYEKWADYPAARARLLALLDETRARNTVIISGDRHFGELSRLDRGAGHPVLYDLTSSSLAKPWSSPPTEANRHRVGSLVADVNFGVIEVDWSTTPATLRFQLHTPTLVALDEPIELVDERAALDAHATSTRTTP